jgi:DNA-directed RNA polymerase specialized sigma24 family protein
MIDLNDPVLDERLRRRITSGRYEIGENELVLSIRGYHAQGHRAAVHKLSEVLLARCVPAFQHYSQGLHHRPDLREEAIANMGEHLLRESLNPNERFMTLNFGHYLQCLCIDEFTRILRQEGLSYKRDDEGRPSGRPQHVPRTLMEPLHQAASDDDSMPGADVADPHDQFETMHAEDESQRILTYLSDPLDRTIMVLRAIEGLKWDDIAVICKRTERTVRLRYERARAYLRECVSRERQVSISPLTQPQS